MDRFKFIVEKMFNAWGLLFAMVIVVTGLFIAIFTHTTGFGTGDHSTFYIFAKSLSEGEVIYKDFIHFRTPGSYYLMALSVLLFGAEQASVMFELVLESHVLYPLLLLGGGILFAGRQSFMAGFSAFITVFWPSILQVRAGLGFLAAGMYASSFRSKKPKKRLILAGTIVGLSVFFGQEIGVLSGISVAATEVVFALRHRKDYSLKRTLYLVTGFALIMVPITLYFAIFSSLKNFLYYTLYYAFLVQPSGMDLPFPEFEYDNRFFYLPFLAYLTAFIVFAFSKRFGPREIVLLMFANLRLLSMLGRSDTLHALFAISEVVMVLWLAFDVALRGVSFSWSRVRFTLIFSVLIFLTYVLATQHEGKAIVLIVPILMAVYWFDSRPTVKRLQVASGPKQVWVASSAVAVAVLFLNYMSPHMIRQINTTRVAWWGRNLPAQISGLREAGMDADAVKEVREVTKALEDLKVETLFSFPLQAYYYTLVEDHSTRFFTFEAQTTEHEQQLTIEDLRNNPPDAVVFDIDQAEGLSRAVGDISAYVFSNFEIYREIVNGPHKTLILTPKVVPAQEDHLLYRLGEDRVNQTVAFGYSDSSAISLHSIRHQNVRPINFSVSLNGPSQLSVGIAPDVFKQADGFVCGEVSVRVSGGLESKSIVCSDEARAFIDVSSETYPAEAAISFSVFDDEAALWLDPVLKGVE